MLRGSRAVSSPENSHSYEDHEVTVANHIGYVDAVRCRTVFGWAYDTRNHGSAPVLRIKINGLDAGIAVAAHPRPDLVSVGINEPRGYECIIPDHIDKVESVSVTVLESEVELPQASAFSICSRTNRPLPPEWKTGNQYGLPSFFILGAAKSGTTSLHNYLGQHPEICVSSSKEPFYFEAEFDRGTTYYFNRYFAHWSDEKIVGEARHRNLYLPYVAQRIHGFNDSARLIVCLRNPTERAVSHWWHWYSRGLETSPLRRALELDWERIRAGLFYEPEPSVRLYSETLQEDGKGYFRTYIDSGYYLEQIQRYLSLFGPEQLHFVFFDDLKLDPQGTTRDVLRFVGADASYASQINYAQLNVSAGEMIHHTDAESLAWLVEHYQPYNQKLSSFIGRDLSHWNFPFQKSSSAKR
jgi:hypothetical protein